MSCFTQDPDAAADDAAPEAEEEEISLMDPTLPIFIQTITTCMLWVLVAAGVGLFWQWKLKKAPKGTQLCNFFSSCWWFFTEGSVCGVRDHFGWEFSKFHLKLSSTIPNYSQLLSHIRRRFGDFFGSVWDGNILELSFWLRFISGLSGTTSWHAHDRKLHVCLGRLAFWEWLFAGAQRLTAVTAGKW